MKYDISRNTITNLTHLKERLISKQFSWEYNVQQLIRAYEANAHGLGELDEYIGEFINQIKKVTECGAEDIVRMCRQIDVVIDKIETMLKGLKIVGGVAAVAALHYATKDKNKDEIAEKQDLSRGAPRNLYETEQEWKTQIDNTFIYNTPDQTAQGLDTQQGKNPEYLGTCGLVSCVNVLRMAGIGINEEEVVQYAAQHRIHYSDGTTEKEPLCITGDSNLSNGGTTCEDREKILYHFGIPTMKMPQTIDNIANAVCEGRGVILSVHATRLYWNRRSFNDLHAVTVLSVKKDANGKVLGFYICDSNSKELGMGAANYYSAEKLKLCLSKQCCNVTRTIIR